MESRNCLAILALVTEMARRLNENISKVHLKPLHETFAATDSSGPVLTGVETSKA